MIEPTDPRYVEQLARWRKHMKRVHGDQWPATVCDDGYMTRTGGITYAKRVSLTELREMTKRLAMQASKNPGPKPRPPANSESVTWTQLTLFSPVIRYEDGEYVGRYE